MAIWDMTERLDCNELPIPRLFQCVEDIRFFAGRGKDEEGYLLRSGCYHDGSGAITVWTAGGECECKLTVCLQVLGVDLTPYEFYVKNEERSLVHERLLSLGVFVDTERQVGREYARQYATIWRFKVCRTHGADRYTVECPECRARIDELYTDRSIEIAATDTVQRLKNTKGSDL